MAPPLFKGHVTTLIRRGPVHNARLPRNGYITRNFHQSCVLAEDLKPKDAKRISPESERAEIDRDFIVSVLDASTSKREAKSYIQRFGSQQRPEKPLAESLALGTVTAVGQASIFAQPDDQASNERAVSGKAEDKPRGIIDEHVHIALVKLRSPQDLNTDTLSGVGKTLSQLNRLGLTSIIVLDCGLPTASQSFIDWKKMVHEQADRVVTVIGQARGLARRVDGVIESSSSGMHVAGKVRGMLLRALKRGNIAVIAPLAYTAEACQSVPVDADDLTYAIAQDITGNGPIRDSSESADAAKRRLIAVRKEASLDRVILLDPAGGPPAEDRQGDAQVFLNLEQEYASLISSLPTATSDSAIHMKNLRLLRKTLRLLPPSSSALVTPPEAVARSSLRATTSEGNSSVGTRRRKNPLIHSLLADKPMTSSSLPMSRLIRSDDEQLARRTTFVKQGMPVTIIPDPRRHPWRPPQPDDLTMSLRDPSVCTSRLVALIEDSFGRQLDIDHYLRRIENRIAGLIIAGDYEGGAILTWESPPSLGDNPDPSRMVPYLDKFAVRRRSQGAGGVADIVFKAMVTDCFPGGVVWRSRRNNPVNKWYFERARGTWKVPETTWTMFWTTEDIDVNSHLFSDYEDVCRHVEPSWANKKIAAD